MDKMKLKIEKLLAKAERTDNVAEAEAFTEMAERLMLKWGIDAAELEAAGEVKPEKIVEKHREYKGGSASYSPSWIQFGYSVAMGLGSLRCLQRTSSRVRRLYVIGHESDVEVYTMLMNSLEIQAMSALHVWQRGETDYRQWMTNWERFKADRQFLVSFAEAVGQRLITLRAEARDTASTGAELVLVSKADRVEDYFGEQYPNLRTSRGTMAGSHEGRAAGRNAGMKASLNQKGVSGSRTAVTS